MMRSSCRNFLDTVQRQYYFNKGSIMINRDFGMGEKIHFYNAMGELRAMMGILIAKILVMHGIDCESELISILPFDLLDNE